MPTRCNIKLSCIGLFRDYFTLHLHPLDPNGVLDTRRSQVPLSPLGPVTVAVIIAHKVRCSHRPSMLSPIRTARVITIRPTE